MGEAMYTMVYSRTVPQQEVSKEEDPMKHGTIGNPRYIILEHLVV
jgi:hypothetical protein